MRTTPLLPALLVLIALPACATRTPPADRIVYRSSDRPSPPADADAPVYPVRQPVRQMTEEERIRWHEEHAPKPPPAPARVVYEQVRYEPPPARCEPSIWWPPITLGLHYSGGHHRRHGWGVGIGHHGYGHYGGHWGW